MYFHMKTLAPLLNKIVFSLKNTVKNCCIVTTNLKFYLKTGSFNNVIKIIIV